ncbi:OTU domain-containing protein [Streptomyces sp. NPDC090080]|uniref:OTU domain-containing protein n=1 Tax=Streptomyces sp. NPDC090080 TaxID=3365939 RepID=UPI0037F8EDB7
MESMIFLDGSESLGRVRAAVGDVDRFLARVARVPEATLGGVWQHFADTYDLQLEPVELDSLHQYALATSTPHSPVPQAEQISRRAQKVADALFVRALDVTASDPHNYGVTVPYSFSDSDGQHRAFYQRLSRLSNPKGGPQHMEPEVLAALDRAGLNPVTTDSGRWRINPKKSRSGVPTEDEIAEAVRQYVDKFDDLPGPGYLERVGPIWVDLYKLVVEQLLHGKVVRWRKVAEEVRKAKWVVPGEDASGLRRLVVPEHLAARQGWRGLPGRREVGWAEASSSPPSVGDLRRLRALVEPHLQGRLDDQTLRQLGRYQPISDSDFAFLVDRFYQRLPGRTFWYEKPLSRQIAHWIHGQVITHNWSEGLLNDVSHHRAASTSSAEIGRALRARPALAVADSPAEAIAHTLDGHPSLFHLVPANASVPRTPGFFTNTTATSIGDASGLLDQDLGSGFVDTSGLMGLWDLDTLLSQVPPSQSELDAMSVEDFTRYLQRIASPSAESATLPDLDASDDMADAFDPSQFPSDDAHMSNGDTRALDNTSVDEETNALGAMDAFEPRPGNLEDALGDVPGGAFWDSLWGEFGGGSFDPGSGFLPGTGFGTGARPGWEGSFQTQAISPDPAFFSPYLNFSDLTPTGFGTSRLPASGMDLAPATPRFQHSPHPTPSGDGYLPAGRHHDPTTALNPPYATGPASQWSSRPAPQPDPFEAYAAQYGLTLQRIADDGDCFYNAVIQGLQAVNPHTDPAFDTQQLRLATAGYLRQQQRAWEQGHPSIWHDLDPAIRAYLPAGTALPPDGSLPPHALEAIITGIETPGSWAGIHGDIVPIVAARLLDLDLIITWPTTDPNHPYPTHHLMHGEHQGTFHVHLTHHQNHYQTLLTTPTPTTTRTPKSSQPTGHAHSDGSERVQAPERPDFLNTARTETSSLPATTPGIAVAPPRVSASPADMRGSRTLDILSSDPDFYGFLPPSTERNTVGKRVHTSLYLHLKAMLGAQSRGILHLPPQLHESLVRAGLRPYFRDERWRISRDFESSGSRSSADVEAAVRQYRKKFDDLPPSNHYEPVNSRWIDLGDVVRRMLTGGSLVPAVAREMVNAGWAQLDTTNRDLAPLRVADGAELRQGVRGRPGPDRRPGWDGAAHPSEADYNRLRIQVADEFNRLFPAASQPAAHAESRFSAPDFHYLVQRFYAELPGRTFWYPDQLSRQIAHWLRGHINVHSSSPQLSRAINTGNNRPQAPAGPKDIRRALTNRPALAISPHPARHIAAALNGQTPTLAPPTTHGSSQQAATQNHAGQPAFDRGPHVLLADASDGITAGLHQHLQDRIAQERDDHPTRSTAETVETMAADPAIRRLLTLLSARITDPNPTAGQSPTPTSEDPTEPSNTHLNDHEHALLTAAVQHHTQQIPNTTENTAAQTENPNAAGDSARELAREVDLLHTVRLALTDSPDGPDTDLDEVSRLYELLTESGATTHRTTRDIAQDIAALLQGQETPRLRGGGRLGDLLNALGGAGHPPARVTAGNFYFANLSSARQDFVAKGKKVLELLYDNSMIGEYLDGVNVRIVLTDAVLESPARITPDLTHGGYQVQLAGYYFEKYSTGYIVGMLAHEFGAHVIPDRRLSVIEEDELFLHAQLPVPGLPTRTMLAANATQPHHILMAIQGNGRHNVYLQTVAHAAMSALSRARRSSDTTAQDITDILDAYLMDLSSVAVTNDNRLLGVPGRSGSAEVRADIATAYNAYRQRLVTDERFERLQHYFPGEKTESDITQEFALLAGRMLTSALGSSSVSKQQFPHPEISGLLATEDPAEEQTSQRRDADAITTDQNNANRHDTDDTSRTNAADQIDSDITGGPLRLDGSWVLRVDTSDAMQAGLLSTLQDRIAVIDRNSSGSSVEELVDSVSQDKLSSAALKGLAANLPGRLRDSLTLQNRHLSASTSHITQNESRGALSSLEHSILEATVDDYVEMRRVADAASASHQPKPGGSEISPSQVRYATTTPEFTNRISLTQMRAQIGDNIGENADALARAIKARVGGVVVDVGASDLEKSMSILQKAAATLDKTLVAEIQGTKISICP